MFPNVFCLPWIDKPPSAFEPRITISELRNGKSKSECKLTVDIDKLQQVFIFTDSKWPKEHSDLEIIIFCQLKGKQLELCTLSQNQRCFVWDDFDSLSMPTRTLLLKASFLCSSLLHNSLNSTIEGQVMQEMNEKTPEGTVSKEIFKGKRKSEKENHTTTPKTKLQRKQVSMRATNSPSTKSLMNKTKKLVECPVEENTVKGITKASVCVNLSARSPKPSSRWGHALCLVDDKRAVLIGGQGDKQQLCRDSIWTLDPEMRTWKLSDITTDSLKPELRVGHTTTYDPTMRCIYIFGGSKKSKWFHDVFMFDLDEQKWTSLVKTNGKAPTRAYHSTTLYRHELWVFGGVYPRPSPQPDASDNEIHIFSPLMEGWYKPIVTGEKPMVRSGHSATLMNDCLFVFGGWDFPFCYNDLHVLDLTTVDWSCPQVNGTPPKPRCWHTSSSLTNNRLFIHGGYDGDIALQDAFVYSVDTHTWNEITLIDGPKARAGHTCIRLLSKYEKEDEDEIIIFGGGDNEDNYFNDMLSIYVPHNNLTSA